ncbi:MAG: hypothetical protein AB1540_15490 [Bdellovibrionota bacterium]
MINIKVPVRISQYWALCSLMAFIFLFNCSVASGARPLITDCSILLTEAEIEPLSSPYLRAGIKQDLFTIPSVKVEGMKIESIVKMTSTYTSPTDPGGFHLSAPLAMQIISQIGIIHGHVLMGFSEKKAEVWMSDYSIKHRKPIRDPDNIKVELVLVESVPVRNNPDALSMTYHFTINGDAATGETKLYFDPPPNE